MPHDTSVFKMRTISAREARGSIFATIAKASIVENSFPSSKIAFMTDTFSALGYGLPSFATWLANASIGSIF
jgi:hypothetical protein